MFDTRNKMPRINQIQSLKVFYECVRKPLLMYRWIGLLPLQGLSNPDSTKTRFTFKSPYTVVYVMNLSLLSMSLAMIYHFRLVQISTIVKNSSGILIMTTSAVVLTAIFRLCKNWRSSLNKIESIELLLPPLRNHKVIIRRVNWFVGIMLILLLTENFSFNVYAIFLVKHCYLLEDDSGWYLKSFFMASSQWFYTYIPFSYTSGVIVQIIKLNGSLIPSLADILIVVITAYLSYRFRNFYRILVQTIKDRTRRRIPWYEIQAHYTRLTKLVSLVDDLISPLIFTVFLSHLLQNCKQIYDVIQKERVAHLFSSTECVLSHSGDAVTVFYLSLSLAVLLLRSLMVSLMTAHLHTLSRAPLNALHTVSTSVYNHDMQKFMDQVYNSKVCLSGLKFFYVTRGTVLSMISTILTYELVLLQINEW